MFLLGNAFFVGAQFALISARRDQLEPLADRRRAARVTLAQVRALPRMLAGSQLGIAACSLGLGAVAEPAFAAVLRDLLRPSGLAGSLLHPVAFVLALAFVSFCHMVLGEMVPKNLALADPVRAALALGPPMAAWVRATRPVLIAVGALADGIVRLTGVSARGERAGAYTATELGDLVSESAAEGLLDREEHRRLQAALRIEATTAADLLTPLGAIVTVGAGVTAREVERLVAETGLSRFPVRAGDDLTGYIHAKDVLAVPDEEADDPLPARLRREMVTVAEDAPVAGVLGAMRRSGTHLARVRRGRQSLGMVTLEAVLRAVVGAPRRPPRA
ncbi:MAG: HlyC/CorC family transporter [Jatrophihabitans sp.]|nr:MAG: HlyC/CorC family transporter [Jatrophihabitans sp.]